ncbi:hypothetical protein CMI40_02135 [Candidatus Pacearchaeota archaeon]|jgi:hypothetical protein|nr:hypothetical protein [Candidatus Pacearchaeota archaeon]|tara:strand:- start:11154 stop:11501 length:348 start_codon:yes stop_codon:yes gene_type:complete
MINQKLNEDGRIIRFQENSIYKGAWVSLKPTKELKKIFGENNLYIVNKDAYENPLEKEDIQFLSFPTKDLKFDEKDFVKIGNCNTTLIVNKETTSNKLYKIISNHAIQVLDKSIN